MSYQTIKLLSCLSLVSLFHGYIGGFLVQFSPVIADQDILVPVAIPGSDFCTRDHLSRLELVFLIDHSEKEIIELAPRIIGLVDPLAKFYPGSKFGLALYSDWECVAWQAHSLCFNPNRTNDYHHDPEGCYTFHEGLTKDTSLIKKRVEPGVIPYYPSGGQEAGVNGIMLTAAEPQMGWTLGNEEIDVNKFIVVITDYKTYVNGTPKSTDGKPRDPPRGDGTDKCSRMKGASAQLTAQVLKRKGISIFVLLNTMDETVWTSWTKALSLMDGVQWHLERVPEDDDVMTNKLKDFITEVALTSPKVTCADPPGYNTLGL